MILPIEQVLARISPNDRVLDLGGSDRVFPRANVVVDLLPYESRKIVYPGHREHFTKDDWIVADFCSHRFWEQIPDKSFDFAIISHTLEDIRDPLYICEQLIRVSKAGYMEAPSRFRECGKLDPADTFSGYSHHRWIIDPNPECTGLIFTPKLSWAHHEDFVTNARRKYLRDYHFQFKGYFWKGSFNYIEHFPKGPPSEVRNLKFFYDRYRYTEAPAITYDLVPDSTDPRNGSCLWVNQYRLPVEQYEQGMPYDLP